jgi:pyrroloquinoline-quinone synthase
MTTPLHASDLSAPPRPLLPSFAQVLTPEELVSGLKALGASYYATHPFHVRMHEGRLTKPQLQGWVANRLAYQRSIPRKDAAIISNCPVAEVRREWLQRIIDHDGLEPGTGGIEMWMQLGEAVGIPREELEDDRHVLPTVRLAVEAYVTFAKTRPWIDAVAATLTELFVPNLMRQRIAAFPQHYPWVRPEGLDYFKSRLTQAPRDSTQGLRLVQTYCTTIEAQRRAFDAVVFHLEQLWVMIDAIHHGYADR